jgi:chromosome partitioning protein
MDQGTSAERQGHVIKIVVHAPKGGVGKTTIALNVALLLARKGLKVWALDLAQGGLMERFLRTREEFEEASGNRIQRKELEELPISFPESRKFDYLVADTDDYFKIYANLLDKTRRGWRVLVPIVPGDPMGLLRIPEETAKLMTGALQLAERPLLHVVMNKSPAAQYQPCRQEVEAAMRGYAVLGLLSKEWLPVAPSSSCPFFIQDKPFCEALERLLGSLEVGI